MTRQTDDGDTRARIRDAAMRQFTEHGFKGATVRGIAKAAGVSPGLVQHHFPSKQALRDACDGYAFDYIRTARADALAAGALLDTGFVADTHEAAVAIARYTATALAGDSAEANRYFDAYVDLTYEVFTSGELGPALPEGQQTRDLAVVHAAMHLGQATFLTQILRALDLDADDPATAVRIGRAQVFLTPDRILGTEMRYRIRTALDRYEDGATNEQEDQAL